MYSIPSCCAATATWGKNGIWFQSRRKTSLPATPPPQQGCQPPRTCGWPRGFWGKRPPLGNPPTHLPFWGLKQKCQIATTTIKIQIHPMKWCRCNIQLIRRLFVLWACACMYYSLSPAQALSQNILAPWKENILQLCCQCLLSNLCQLYWLQCKWTVQDIFTLLLLWSREQ